jgi:hypothetical protein
MHPSDTEKKITIETPETPTTTMLPDLKSCLKKPDTPKKELQVIFNDLANQVHAIPKEGCGKKIKPKRKVTTTSSSTSTGRRPRSKTIRAMPLVPAAAIPDTSIVLQLLDTTNEKRPCTKVVASPESRLKDIGVFAPGCSFFHKGHTTQNENMTLIELGIVDNGSILIIKNSDDTEQSATSYLPG